MFLNKADKNCGTESTELITSEEEKSVIQNLKSPQIHEIIILICWKHET